MFLELQVISQNKAEILEDDKLHFESFVEFFILPLKLQGYKFDQSSASVLLLLS